MNKVKSLIICLCLLALANSKAQVPGSSTDAASLHRAQRALTDVIIHDIFSPTGASRIYAYSNIAAYEVLVKANQSYHSLYGQVKTFPDLPAPTTKIDYTVSAITAFFLTGKKLVYSDDMLEDSMQVVMTSLKNRKLSAAVF